MSSVYADSKLMQPLPDKLSFDLQKLIGSVHNIRFGGIITVCDYYIETIYEVAKAYNVPCPFAAHVKTVRQKH